jgi:hypothetical protein
VKPKNALVHGAPKLRTVDQGSVSYDLKVTPGSGLQLKNDVYIFRGLHKAKNM